MPQHPRCWDPRCWDPRCWDHNTSQIQISGHFGCAGRIFDRGGASVKKRGALIEFVPRLAFEVGVHRHGERDDVADFTDKLDGLGLGFVGDVIAVNGVDAGPDWDEAYDRGIGAWC